MAKKKFRLYAEVRSQLVVKTVGSAMWRLSSETQRASIVKAAVNSVLGPGGGPWQIVESPDAPITSIRNVYAHDDTLYIEAKTIPPESQRVVSYKDNPKLVEFWMNVTGPPASIYPQ